MHNTIDVRGLAAEVASAAVTEASQVAGISSLEVRTSESAIAIELIELLSKKGARCELLEADEGQTLVANFAAPQVLENKSMVIGADKLGSGDDVIGTKLMNAFFNVSSDYDQVPKAIFFLNTAVKLCVTDADALAGIQKLQQKGCDVIVCGTCLDFFGIKDQLQVGRVGTMHDLIGIYHHSQDVISI